MKVDESAWHPANTPYRIHDDSYDFIAAKKYAGKLREKTVLITGAGRGIGRATALAFAAAGAHVACVARTREEIEQVTAEIRQKYGVKAIAIAGDVRDAQMANTAVRQTQDALGPVDILINNAGLSRISDVEHEKDVEAPWKVIETNMRGTLTFVHAVLPSMIARHQGTIVNVVSIIGQINLPYFSAYAASKAGLVAYTNSIDLELRPKGIKTFALHPCMSKETSIGRGALNDDAAAAVPEMQTFLQDFLAAEHDKVRLPADTMVALCVEESAHLLSGQFVDATHDLGQVIVASSH